MSLHLPRALPLAPPRPALPIHRHAPSLPTVVSLRSGAIVGFPAPARSGLQLIAPRIACIRAARSRSFLPSPFPFLPGAPFINRGLPPAACAVGPALSPAPRCPQTGIPSAGEGAPRPASPTGAKADSPAHSFRTAHLHTFPPSDLHTIPTLNTPSPRSSSSFSSPSSGLYHRGIKTFHRHRSLQGHDRPIPVTVSTPHHHYHSH